MHTYYVISCKIVRFCFLKKDVVSFHNVTFRLLVVLIFWVFWVTALIFVNISIFHTFPTVLGDIVATCFRLTYKCDTYLKSLLFLLFNDISQLDAMYKKNEENLVSSPKPDFCNFLTVSDHFQ